MKGAVLACAVALTACAGSHGTQLSLDAQEPDAPQLAPARELAPDLFLLEGGYRSGWSPDGNTVVLRAPRGLIVFDTGRHVWHSNAILAFANAEHKPLAAIVNSHWHFDHVSGNHRLIERFPGLRIYASRAIERALTTEAPDLAAARAQLLDPALSPHLRAELQIYVDALDAPSSLLPTDPVERSGSIRIAGRALDVNLAPNAVSDGDVWLFDRRTGVAIVGDLVTMPTPWFESACPEQWAEALDAISATPFTLLIPGHGAPMNRDQFELYRRGFHGFVDCVAGQASNEQCAADWREDITPLLEDTQDARDLAEGMALYYAGFLRRNGGRSPTCLIR